MYRKTLPLKKKYGDTSTVLVRVKVVIVVVLSFAHCLKKEDMGVRAHYVLQFV